MQYFCKFFITFNLVVFFAEADYRWPNKAVYFKISELIDAAHAAVLFNGMAEIEAKSCLRFYSAGAYRTKYVYITLNTAKGCASNIGYQDKQQVLKLEMAPVGVGCFNKTFFQHEMCHTLGFCHEHNTSDRDDYVTIMNDNIQEGAKQHFNKTTCPYRGNFGCGYDFSSIMHYRADAFSKNGLKTIVTKDSTAKIGQRIAMTDQDFCKINAMYNC